MYLQGDILRFTLAENLDVIISDKEHHEFKLGGKNLFEIEHLDGHFFLNYKTGQISIDYRPDSMAERIIFAHYGTNKRDILNCVKDKITHFLGLNNKE